MSYPIKIPQDQMRCLWLNKQFCGGKSIAQQARDAISDYLQKRSVELGGDVKDLGEAIEKHERESCQA